MARCEITIISTEAPDGSLSQTISGMKYEGDASGMQKMEEMTPHACFAHCLAMMQTFHMDVDAKMSVKRPVVQLARVGRG